MLLLALAGRVASAVVGRQPRLDFADQDGQAVCVIVVLGEREEVGCDQLTVDRLALQTILLL